MRTTIVSLCLVLWASAVLCPAGAQEWAVERLEASPRHHEWVDVPAGEGRTVRSFVAYPESSAKTLAVVVIHENRGLSELAVEAEAQLGGKLPLGLGKLVAKFSSGIKAGASHATTARQQMRRYPDRLIDLTNALLEDATRRLQETKPGGLVLLFDNLDRYDADEINKVLIRGSNLLRRLGCHALFTIPVDLEYNPRWGPLRDAYGQPVVLPMIPLRHAGDSWGQNVANSQHERAAVEGLRAALAKRVAIEDVFVQPPDSEVLVRMSGGCIRDLMHLMTLSYEMSDGEKLSTRGVHRAVAELRATHARELEQADYDRLADIAAWRAVPRDELTLRLLYNRWALEYYDERGDVWLDVHPLVIEIKEFQRAYLGRQVTTHG